MSWIGGCGEGGVDQRNSSSGTASERNSVVPLNGDVHIRSEYPVYQETAAAVHA